MTKIADVTAERLARCAPHKEALRGKIRAARKAGQDTTYFEDVLANVVAREIRLKGELKQFAKAAKPAKGKAQEPVKPVKRARKAA